jgi:hypothetical protein
MKLSPTVSKYLTNKWVLHFVALLALLNVIAFGVLGKVKAMLTFFAFAVLVRYFSNNMTVVLGVPLILVNLLALQGNMLEGMENNATPDATKAPDATVKPTVDAKDAQKAADQKKIDDLVEKQKNKPDAKTGQGLNMNPIEDGVLGDDNAAQTTGGEQQGFEAGRRKNRGYEIDYATTVEDAYDQLNDILGGDGIKRLTSDTQGLMKQQMQLAEAMKGMGPVIEQIAPMMESLKGMMGDGKEGLGGILDLAKKITGPKK